MKKALCLIGGIVLSASSVAAMASEVKDVSEEDYVDVAVQEVDTKSDDSDVKKKESLFAPKLMSEEKAVAIVNDINDKYKILHTPEDFDDFLGFFMQMERDFVNNANMFLRMKSCSPTIGQVNYSPAVDTRYETYVSMHQVGDECHYMSQDVGSSRISMCVFSPEEMDAVSEEGFALYSKAQEELNEGIHTNILGAQPIFAELLSPENCKIVTATN